VPPVPVPPVPVPPVPVPAVPPEAPPVPPEPALLPPVPALPASPAPPVAPEPPSPDAPDAPDAPELPASPPPPVVPAFAVPASPPLAAPVESASPPHAAKASVSAPTPTRSHRLPWNSRDPCNLDIAVASRESVENTTCDGKKIALSNAGERVRDTFLDVKPAQVLGTAGHGFSRNASSKTRHKTSHAIERLTRPRPWTWISTRQQEPTSPDVSRRPRRPRPRRRS
jgi:hypothetical protein